MKRIKTASRQATRKLKRTFSKLNLRSSKGDDEKSFGHDRPEGWMAYQNPEATASLFAAAVCPQQSAALPDGEQGYVSIDRAMGGTTGQAEWQAYILPELQASSAHSRRGDDEADEAEVARRERRRLRREREEREKKRERKKREEKRTRRRSRDLPADQSGDSESAYQDARGRHHRTRRESLASSSSETEGRTKERRHSRHHQRSVSSSTTAEESSDESDRRAQQKEKQRRRREREMERDRRKQAHLERTERERRREALRLELDSRMVQGRGTSDHDLMMGVDAPSGGSISDASEASEAAPPDVEEKRTGEVAAYREAWSGDDDMADILDEARVKSPVRDHPSEPSRTQEDENDVAMAL